MSEPAGSDEPATDGALRSGFVTVVGRPNVGKSTLINRILGTKVTIVSPRPNTTRRSVRGVLHRPGFQAVFVDTPGLHRPRTALGRRLNEQIGEALDEIDVVVPVIDATASIGPGDRLVLQRAAASSRAATRTPEVPAGDLSRLLLVVNKIDKASPGQVLRQLADAQRILESTDAVDALETGAADTGAVEVGETGGGGETLDGSVVVADSGAQYFPISAVNGRGVDALVTAVLDLLPEGPPYYPEEMTSDVGEWFWVGELVREQLLATVREELPHSIACRVTEWEWPRIRVEILVERESQKGIVIGQGGLVLKAVGTAVRAQLPEGAFVELFVRVEKRWQQRPETIERLGY
ncbi:MAG TPA: GTPase Era [Acidimicrobiales bacterium]|nr:GTPase Era [Acidimicrobiales bacterium]